MHSLVLGPPLPPAAGIDSAADRDELQLPAAERAEESERDTSQTTNDMSDAQQTASCMSNRESPPVDSSAADPPLASRPPEAESAAITAAASSYWRPTGWSQLPTDFIECITGFLPLRSLPLASAVCRGWRSGIESMSARDDELQLPPIRLLHLLTSSARRYIASLAISRDGLFAPLSIETLFLLQLAMPHLTFLRCAIVWPVGPMDDHPPIRPPMQLRYLDITFNLESIVSAPSLTAAMVWSHLEHVLDDLTQVRTLTALSVELTFKKEHARIMTSAVPLSALQPLLRLRDTLQALWLLMPASQLQALEPLTPDHIDFIRSLHCVTDLSLAGLTRWTPLELDWLTAEPMTMQLMHLDLRFTTIDDAHTAALGRLTSTTRLFPSRLDLSNPSFLAGMTLLTKVSIICASRVDPALLISALSNCSRIEHLGLEHGGMTDVHLGTLLPSLPRLHDLKLERMPSLTSLSFASTVPHLSCTLHRLRLDRCQSLLPTSCFICAHSLHCASSNAKTASPSRLMPTRAHA